ncbi:MAG: hypothetical protein JWP94_3121 [Mucilaginibacter sp.]|jgi:hypothetical protein|nr:hypothetical protein [Mucilaginibacter sp.]
MEALKTGGGKSQNCYLQPAYCNATKIKSIPYKF